MILFRNFTATVTSSEATLFTLIGQNPNGLSLTLENKDSLNYITYRFQEADQNVNSDFADLDSGGSGNIAVEGILSPGSKVMVSIRSSSSYVRLLGVSSGGADLDIGLLQFSSNSSSNLSLGNL